MNKHYLIMLLLLAFSATVNAQFGELDSTLDPGSGADNVIQAMAVAQDQQIIIGGDFLTYRGVSKKRIARINYDGTQDLTFNVGSGANKMVNAIVIQPDSKIIVAGQFSIFNNTSKKRIVRLNHDGSIDTSFNTGLGANDDIQSCVLQPDGKIMVGGLFTSFNWIQRNGIARLNADGSLDTDFSFIDEPLSVTDIKLLADGKYLVNGANRILRLNADGSKDETFYTGAGTDYPIQSICVQTGGKILVGGYFTIYDGIPTSRFLRLNADGTRDESFASGVGTNYGVVSISEQFDGQILISGIFSTYNNVAREKVARLNPDGTLDESFNPILGPNNIVLHHLIQPDGRILISGDFTEYNGVPRNKIARISAFSFLSTNHASMSKAVSVYPNPAVDYVNVVMPEGELIQSAAIYDVTGKLVHELRQSLNRIDVGGLSKGMYLLTVTSASGQFQTKFIKQ